MILVHKWTKEHPVCCKEAILTFSSRDNGKVLVWEKREQEG